MKNILKYTLLVSLMQASSLCPAHSSVRKNILLNAVSEAEPAGLAQNNAEGNMQQESDSAQQKKSSDDKSDFRKNHPIITNIIETVSGAYLSFVVLRYINQRKYEQASQALHDKNEAAINETQRFLERCDGFCEGLEFSKPISPINVKINSEDNDLFTKLFNQGFYNPVSAAIKDGQALFNELQGSNNRAAEKIGECIHFLKKIHFETSLNGYSVRTHMVEYFKEMTFGVIESMGKLLRIAASSKESAPFGKKGRIFFSSLEEQCRAYATYNRKMKNIVAVFKYMPFSKRIELMQEMQAAIIEQQTILRLFKACMAALNPSTEKPDLKSLTAFGILLDYETCLRSSSKDSIARLQEDLMKAYRSRYA